MKNPEIEIKQYNITKNLKIEIKKYSEKGKIVKEIHVFGRNLDLTVTLYPKSKK